MAKKSAVSDAMNSSSCLCTGSFWRNQRQFLAKLARWRLRFARLQMVLPPALCTCTKTTLPTLARTRASAIARCSTAAGPTAREGGLKGLISGTKRPSSRHPQIKAIPTCTRVMTPRVRRSESARHARLAKPLLA
jgi:hypothetical protein